MTYMCISFVVPVTKLFVDSAHFKCLEQHDPHDSCSVPFPSETISRQDFEATAGQILQISKHFSDDPLPNSISWWHLLHPSGSIFTFELKSCYFLFILVFFKQFERQCFTNKQICKILSAGRDNLNSTDAKAPKNLALLLWNNHEADLFGPIL